MSVSAPDGSSTPHIGERFSPAENPAQMSGVFLRLADKNVSVIGDGYLESW